ncbi:MAG: hypothetical protein ACK4YQ_07390 [Phenylobacterium sp.]|uniref:hypothetical protein n=1 Tax=Phenylobacterium sp. TaxID=1871053 RepID=UPI00391C3BA8
MLRTFLRNKVQAFEKTWNYDASYQRFLVESAPLSALKFGIGASMVDRGAAPAEALAAAGIAATLAEDCGPCVQIGVDMAAAAGVRAEVLRAILAGDEGAMGADAALAWRFARASLARDLEAADPLREAVARRWGERGLCAIALSITTARMYPTLKYALGYGKTCSRVTVDGAAAPLAPRPRQAA